MRIAVEKEILDRQMAELYEAIKDSPASNSKLDMLELIIAHPGELYHQVIREQFSPVAALINEVSRADISQTEKRAQSHFHEKYLHLLALLLQKAMPAKDVLALLQVNPDYVPSIFSTLGDTAAASALQTLLGELRIRGISDTEIANLMLPPEQAKALLALLLQEAMPAKNVLVLLQVDPDYLRSILRTLGDTAAASELQTLLGGVRIPGISNTAIANLMPPPEHAKALPEFEEDAGVSESKISESEEKPAFPTKAIFEKYLALQIKSLKERTIYRPIITFLTSLPLEERTPIDYSIIKLLTLLPDDDFRETVIRFCLSTQFLKSSSGSKDSMQGLLSVMRHLQSLGVTPETIIAAFNSQNPSFNILNYTVLQKRVPQFTALVNYLSEVIDKSPDTTEKINALLEDGRTHLDIMPMLDRMVESSSENSVVALKSYHELCIKIRRETVASKKTTYKAMLNRLQALSQYQLTKSYLTDHATVIEILRGDEKFSNRLKHTRYPESKDLGLISLLIFSDICSTTELSFDVLFMAIQNIHLKIETYNNEDIKILSLSLMAIFRKEPTPDNAEKIYRLLNYNARTRFGRLALFRWSTEITPLEHIEKFFELLDLLSGKGVSDLKIQTLTCKLTYHNTYCLGHILDDTGDKMDIHKILKILSRNYLNDSLISALPSGDFHNRLTQHINSLDENSRYEVSLAVITGTSSLAKYYDQDGRENHRYHRGTLVSFIKTKIPSLIQQIIEGKFTKDELGKLAFLKEEIIANINVGQAIEALNPSSALGQFFYLSRGLRSADLSRGNLSIIFCVLRTKIPYILTYILESYLESSDLISLNVFKSELEEHLGTLDIFEDSYLNAMNMTTPLGKYYWVNNGYIPVTSSAPVMRKLNLILATKTDLFLTKVNSGVLSREGFSAASLKEIQDAFLKAIKDLPNDQYKTLLRRIVIEASVGDVPLRVFFADRQAELRALLTRLNAVTASTVADAGAASGGLFSRLGFRAKTATAEAPDDEVDEYKDSTREIGDRHL